MFLSINDCKGLSVTLPQQFIKSLQPQLLSEDCYDSLTKVIESPGLIIETRAGSVRYYFRAIGWNCNALIKVELQKDKWRATEGYINPSGDILGSLFREGVIMEDRLTA